MTDPTDTPPPVADQSLIRLYLALKKPPAGASWEDVEAALYRVLQRAQDYSRLATVIERGGEAKLVSLIRGAAPFVNAVAVIAEDKSKALAWLAEAALTIGTPDPEYACGAAYCDDAACTSHNRSHPNHG